MNWAEERARLFGIYSSNLALYTALRDRFLCPMCGREFDESALHTKPPELCIAHIIPKAVGGTIYTLACRACDNGLGSRFDSHRKDEQQFHDLLLGRSSVEAVVRADGCQFPVDLRFNSAQRRIDVRVLPKHAAPGAFGRFIASWGEGSRSNVTFWTGDTRRVILSLLCSALLTMFRQYGYEYVLQSHIQDVRRLIQDPDAGPLPSIVTTIPAGATLASGHPLSCPSINVVTEPRDCSCFMIVLPGPSELAAMRGVLIPGFGENAGRSYQTLLADPMKAARFTMLDWHAVDAIADARSFGWGSRLWGRAVGVASGDRQ
ncbi:MAG TPA: HNH endonuclease [Terriglobales bacterium]|nr:HNH endonuclease [Terriglobales bacterium]